MYRIVHRVVLFSIAALFGVAAHAADGGQRVTLTKRIDDLGTTRALYNVDAAPYAGSPEAAARAFLAAPGGAVLSKASPASLRHVATITSPAGAHVRFTQTVGGIPVLGADVVVSMTAQHAVTMVINNTRAVDDGVAVAPALDSASAVARASASLGLRGRTIGQTPAARLVIARVADGGERLCYRVTMTAEEPAGDWEVLLDAQTGAVLSTRDLFVQYREGPVGSARALVYRTDPLSAAHQKYGAPGFVDADNATSDSLDRYRTEVVLDSLAPGPDGFRLAGPGCTVEDIELPADPAYAVDDQVGFASSRNQPEFEAAMAYYHIRQAYRRVLALGFSAPQLEALRVDPHGLQGRDNSHYSPSGNWIAFGAGGVDDAEDADVIWHEYAHAIQYTLVPSWGGGEAGALGEGFGDYWAASYSRSLREWNRGEDEYSWLFNWDGHNTFWAGRTSGDARTYPFGTLAVHAAGQIWCAALMGIWDDLGRDVTDRLVLQSLLYLGGGVTATDNAMAILQADRDLYGGEHLPTLTYWLSSVKRFIPPPGDFRVLVVNDNAVAPAISGNKGTNVLFPGAERSSSASTILAALTRTGVAVQSTSFSSLDTAGLSSFDVVVVSAGWNTLPFNDPARRAALVRFVRNGGRIIVEGGEVGYAYRALEDGADEADADFRREVLHAAGFVSDADGAALRQCTGEGRLFSSPYRLTGTLRITPRSLYGDRDAVTVNAAESGTVIMAEWAGIPGGAAAVGHLTDNGSVQTLFLPFALASLADTAEASALAWNALALFLPGSLVADVDAPGEAAVPVSCALLPNYPNPFNPSTTVSFAIPRAADVSLTVYDLLGREVTRLLAAPLVAGTHAVSWNARDCASGTYVVRLEVREAGSAPLVFTRRMALVK